MTRLSSRRFGRVLLPCLLAGLVACGPLRRPGAPAPEPVATEEVWVIRRQSAATAAPPAAPALAARPVGQALAPTPLALATTAIDVAVLGPIVSLTRHKRYRPPGEGMDGFVVFTPPTAPVRQDLHLTVRHRAVRVLVRPSSDAVPDDVEGRRVTEVTPEPDGRVVVPIGPLAPRDSPALTVESVGVAGWSEGGYEILIPRVPDGDVSLVVDLHGAGPIVVVSSPTHTINATAVTMDRLRVGLRVPIALRDEDFLLRYRVDARERPGAIVSAPLGTGTLLGLFLHPQEVDHVPVGLSHVHVAWESTPGTGAHPVPPPSITAGTPLMLVGRIDGPAPPGATIVARLAGRPRTFRVVSVPDAPAPVLRGLAVLWGRTRRSATIP